MGGPGRKPGLNWLRHWRRRLRRQQLLSLFDGSGLGLEIGPSFNPLCPKREGYRVEILDHTDAEGLALKYRDAGVDLSKIEPVDYVSAGGALFDAVGHEARYDFIVASHVIEHTVDPIGFLRDCQRLLKPAGRLVLAVPDKRFSFDVLRPPTSAGEVVQAHLDGRQRHTLGAVFDELAYNALRDGKLAWGPGDRGSLAFDRPLARAKQDFELARQTEAFIDIHAWQFTPSSFRLIVHDLCEFGFHGLRENGFIEGEAEFFIALSAGGAGPAASRIELARQAVAELGAVRI